MPLERIRQVGDVILVDSSDSLAEGFNPERYSKVINCQVITESGQALGRVLGYSFDIETGELITLVLGALGIPLLAEGVLSTWELPVTEVVSSGSDRIIVYEGAEQKLKQLGTGLLEKMGIGASSWEREERDRYRMGPVPAENQLPAGQLSQQEQRRIQPASARAFQPEEEMEVVEMEERRQREPLRQRRYLDEEGPQEPYRPSYGDRQTYGRDPYSSPERAFERAPERAPYPEERASERPSPRERVPNPDREEDQGWPPASGRELDEQRDPFPERASSPRSYGPEPSNGSSASSGRWEREERDARAGEDESKSRRRPPAEPLDVEPEILDDPW
jgi:sporulation protein YlmC with PRC-barrel domain